jgi:hypothetical protein
MSDEPQDGSVTWATIGAIVALAAILSACLCGGVIPLDDDGQPVALRSFGLVRIAPAPGPANIGCHRRVPLASNPAGSAMV